MIDRVDCRPWLNPGKNEEKTRKIFCLLVLVVAIILSFPAAGMCNTMAVVKLGNEVLMEKHYHLIDGKKLGLVTNQTDETSRPLWSRARY